MTAATPSPPPAETALVEPPPDRTSWWQVEGWGTLHRFRPGTLVNVNRGYRNGWETLCGRGAERDRITPEGPGSGDRCGQCGRRP